MSENAKNPEKGYNKANESLFDKYVKKFGPAEQWGYRESIGWMLVGHYKWSLDMVFSHITSLSVYNIEKMSGDQIRNLGLLGRTAIKHEIEKSELEEMITDIINYNCNTMVIGKIVAFCIEGIIIGDYNNFRVKLPWHYARIIMKNWHDVDDKYDLVTMLDYLMVLYRRNIDSRVLEALKRTETLEEFRNVVKASLYGVSYDKLMSVMVLNDWDTRKKYLAALTAKQRIGYKITEIK